MQPHWTKIFTTANPVESSMVLSMLQENGIDAVEMNKRDSSYLSFGMIEVYCPAEKVITAIHLIESNRTENS
jgi:hypothetical protein